MSVQCPSCKAYLALSNPVTCPRCNGPLPQAASASNAHTLSRQRTENSTRGLFGTAVGIAIVAAFGLIIYRIAVPSDHQLYERKVAQALVSCQHRLVGRAKFGGAEMPPVVQNHGRDGEFYFAWPTGSFHFKNGFGGSIKMSASCIGEVSTGEIKHLTLSGEDVL